MSSEPIETEHLPTFIKEEVGKLHRYINSGEQLAKSELQRLMSAVHGLIHHLPAEEGAVEHEAMDFEARVEAGVRAALPQAEAFITEARQRIATAESKAAAAETYATEALTAYREDLTRLAHVGEDEKQVLRDQITELEGKLTAAEKDKHDIALGSAPPAPDTKLAETDATG